MQPIAINNSLKQHIGNLCKNQYDRITEICHSDLLYLFRHLGMSLNKANATSELIEELGDSLKERYGPYFDTENLRRMEMFDERILATPKLFELCRYVTWEHIIHLLPFNDLSVWVFYIRAAHKNDWTVEELKNAINQRAYERDETFLGKTQPTKALQKSVSHNAIDESFLPLWFISHQKYDWKPLFNVFKEPLLSSFKPYLQIAEPVPEINFYEKKDMLTEIGNHIEWTRSNVNKFLNEGFNSFLREIGRSLKPDNINNSAPPVKNSELTGKTTYIEAISVIQTPGQSHEFREVFTPDEFEEREKVKTEITDSLLETLFTDAQLQNMLLFAETVTDTKKLFKIAHLVTWGQLIELLKLNDEDIILRYALKCADEKLSIAQLKEVVALELLSPAKPIKKTKIKDIEIYNKKVAMNILHNNFFMNFISAF